ncbi:MAG TPA: molecular chaperone [Franconibacter helveticus]|uniref:fimbrial biogenesis chaperone n=1 Tax=Franconibacter helveticus TaxID=357240 RepID=UPI000403E859|nr:molecular chaperone [Franconibacter helveticus]MDU6926453.1 molecular chaperone [Franconibacter helveticus]HAZ54100.1 molecular chaperone [Franconibacter helveticus]
MKKLFLTVMMSAAFWSGMSNAALMLSADRLVYNEKEGDASVTVRSDEDRAYLVQSWLDAGDSAVKKDLPFVVTPPLFRLAPKSDNVIRVVYLGKGLPTDRESLFWLDVKGVPGLNDEETKIESRMVLAINNRIKFFFRPAGLEGTPDEAVKKLHWIRSGNNVTAKNDTPFNLVLNKIVIDKESVPVSVVTNNTVIPAFGSKTYTLKHKPASGSAVEWDAVNDAGATSEPLSQPLE